MDDFKGKISKEVLDSLTMEDLWKSPGLKNYVEKNYPRAYLAVTEPWREFGLYSFIKIADDMRYRKQKGEFKSFREAYRWAEKNRSTFNVPNITASKLERAYHKWKSEGRVGEKKLQK
tara:strand:+ start:227 stop:580 length:354 start_codon:yes stop_codon:yes gene_type:complete